KCYQCHGEALQISKLDLRTQESILKGGEKGPAIVPGDSAASRLYRRVAGLEQPAMPMTPLPSLTPQEVAILKDWIDQRANWTAAETPKTEPAQNKQAAGGYGKGYQERIITDQDRKWWAFQKPVRYPVPKVADARWSANPIDAFVKKALDEKGLTAAPEADRNTLIRRASLDLIGLLPTPEEVDAFINDSSP